MSETLFAEALGTNRGSSRPGEYKFDEIDEENFSRALLSLFGASEDDRQTRDYKNLVSELLLYIRDDELEREDAVLNRSDFIMRVDNYEWREKRLKQVWKIASAELYKLLSAKANKERMTPAQATSFSKVELTRIYSHELRPVGRKDQTLFLKKIWNGVRTDHPAYDLLVETPEEEIVKKLTASDWEEIAGVYIEALMENPWEAFTFLLDKARESAYDKLVEILKR